MYYNKCPRCGGELGSVCQWDIVVDQYCYDEENCGWEKSVASVGGFAGEQYPVFYDDCDDDDDYDWGYGQEEDDEEEMDRDKYADFVGDDIDPDYEGGLEDTETDEEYMEIPF